MRRGYRAAGNPAFYQLIRRVCGLQARLGDPTGVRRHSAGATNQSVWDYAPSIPAFPIGPQVRSFVWTFDAPADVICDAVGSNDYRWNESNSGTGTRLAVQDVVGGGAQFTNGTGDNNYYFYESGAEIAQLVSQYDLWFEVVLQVSDATQSDMFVGLCARLASGNLFDNRVNSVGFRKDDGDASIDLETSLAGVTTSSTAQGTLADATDISLGMHYRGDQQTVYFFIDDSMVNIIDTTLPTTEMCVSFGLRNGEAAAKSMLVKIIKLMVEVPA